MESIQQVAAFGTQHMDLPAGRESDAAMDRFEQGIVALVSERLGMRAVKSGGSMGSRYYEISVGEESVEFRVSNHKQRYNGPVWSFTAGDDAKAIGWGIEAIEAAIAEAKECK